MRALVVLVLLLAPAFPVSGQSPSCVTQTQQHRQQHDYWVSVEHRLCADGGSARHTFTVRVTQGPPSDNRSVVLAHVLYEHDRTGERQGAHGIREHAHARSGENVVVAWYNSTRTGDGYTSCSVFANATHPRGNATARMPLAACVPQEALQP